MEQANNAPNKCKWADGSFTSLQGHFDADFTLHHDLAWFKRDDFLDSLDHYEIALRTFEMHGANSARETWTRKRNRA